MSKLHISDTLSLPLDAVTQTFAVLGIRGSGKTNTAKVLAEEMLKAGQQIVALDPTDAWYGIRSSKDGKSEGFKVYVFGGEHGDLPLRDTNGAELARFVIETGASVVFSLRHMGIGEQKRFAADFGETLRNLKSTSANRTPLHVFLDEAEEFVPQIMRPDDARMFGAYNRMVRRDRNIGLGITLISQRPQSVNKEPLSQIETLICHRLLHKLDRKSVKESWVEGHDVGDRAEEFFDSLASLNKGDTWVWSPEWLDIFKRVHIREAETFDSSRTPKPGEKVRTVAKLAPVDLSALKDRLGKVVENAKAEDPKELRKQIAELKSDLAKTLKNPVHVLQEKIVEVPVLTKDQINDLHEVFEGFRSVSEIFLSGLAKLHSAPRPQVSRVPVQPIRKLPSPAPSRPINGNPSNSGDLTGPEQNILNQVAELAALGIGQPDKAQVALMAGYTNFRSGGFSEPLSRLLQAGLITYPTPGIVALTDDGERRAHPVDAPLSADELHERLCRKLGGPEEKILREIIAAYPDALTKEDLGAKLGYTNVRSGGFSEPVGRLKSLGIIDYPRAGLVKAADWLFVA